MKHAPSRIEGFSDSVFAFAATLLVVSLEVPSDMAQLLEIRIGFISFGLSFLALALLWKIHYNYFRRVKDIDNVIIALNMIMLFVVLFYVFPLKFLTNMFIGKSGTGGIQDLAMIFELYGLGFSCIFICVSLMYWRAATITKEVNHKRELSFFSRHFAIFVLVGGLSIIAAFSGIGLRYGLPGWVYPLLGPLCFWHGNSKKYGFKGASSI